MRPCSARPDHSEPDNSGPERGRADTLPAADGASTDSPLGRRWASSLSVAEHAAVREAGFTPQGLVMGSCVYHLGPVYSPWDYYGAWNTGSTGAGWGPGTVGIAPRGVFGGPSIAGPGAGGVVGGYGRAHAFPGWYRSYSWDELGVGSALASPSAATSFSGTVGWGAAAVAWERIGFEAGVEDAARRALARLSAEAGALGAHGVIGTRIAFRHLDGMASSIEFTAIGTAVTRPSAPRLPAPFTSHLSGQDLLKLLRDGMVPVAAGVGAGSTQVSVARWSVMGATTELRPFADGIEASRRLAAEHLAAALPAGDAVVGTLASTSLHGEGDGQVATVVLTGTLVRRFATGHWERLPLPVMRLSRQ
jgi:uncharacterized protein YbjQ (UPF0145 family)